MIRRLLGRLALWLSWFLLAVAGLWCLGALGFDCEGAVAKTFAILGFLVACGTALVLLKRRWQTMLALLGVFSLVIAWWLALEPKNDRPWQPDVAQLARAEIQGDVITFHNVRNCTYRTEMDYTPHWESRTVRLSQLTGLDLAVNYWGSPWVAHPIASFQFADAPPLCFSIEMRKEIGETYSTLAALYRTYELIYVVADERDIVRVRTNFRKGEDVYLYRCTLPAEQARARFLEYIHALNVLHAAPRWYHMATANCTTSIRHQRDASQRGQWDWRLLLNGKGDEMLYEHGALITGGLAFPEFKARSLINPAAQACENLHGFSQSIRADLPVAEARRPTP